MNRRQVLGLAGSAVLAATGARCTSGGGAGLPVYTWEQLDDNYPYQEWAHELTERRGRPVMQGNGGWQRVAYLRGTGRQNVLWVKRR